MARRVALARAIALDPMLVMYDEPFAGLDPISLGVVGQLIRKLNDALGITSVVVTHDVYESLKIVDYIYFVSEGRIVAQGTPDEVRASARRRSCASSSTASRTARCRSTIRRAPYRAELFARAGASRPASPTSLRRMGAGDDRDRRAAGLRRALLRSRSLRTRRRRSAGCR